ncbi:MAG: o-succinylbenzoate--CoA ligase [Kurthia sp.]|nr:o-succinylbenzoate--CoA ligase [Candidatus Kurthia equi]
MIPNWIEQRAGLTPKRVALTFNKQQWTFEELSQQSKYYVQVLTDAGITTGQRVAIYGKSTPQLVKIIFACMQLQVEMVLLNLRLSKPELQYQLEDAAVHAILIDDDLVEGLPNTTTPQLKFSLFEQSVTEGTVIQRWNRETTMTIMYTSGTTNLPKGVRQTVGNHLASATSSLYNTGLVEDEAWICTVPIFHISGFSMLCKCILHGVRLDLYEKYDVESVAQQLIEGTATRMSAVAIMLEKIISHIEKSGKKASPRFQLILGGGGPIPEDYLKRAHAIGIRVAQTYGMTETSSQTATLSSEDALRKLGSAGKALMFNEIKIDGATQAGEHGEICVRGEHVTPGYIGRHAHIPTTVDGWLHTGDIGYMDEEGYLYVADRRSDLIISGGENIYPAEIENVLLGHPAVLGAGVCAVANDVWGQRPIAFIVKKKDVTSEELAVYCKEHLAKYKIPDAFYFIEELPRNGAGKLMRRKLHAYIEI